jgi:H/ACA ribonucleoprotein complex subunit 3
MKSTNDIYVAGKRLRLDSRQMVGSGGEAEIYDIGQGRVLKLYKAPEHGDFAMHPQSREAARQRIAEQQKKLALFPRHLPDGVIVPQHLASADAAGQRIVGFTMRFLQGAEVLLRFGDRAFRESSGTDGNHIKAIFRGLHLLVTQIHQKGVVIGDFNDLNVLIGGGTAGCNEVFMIDADSFQFGTFPCRVFTARFVDPLICDMSANSLMQARPHSAQSDWYAFCVMLMQSLLYVDPYGGLYKPKDVTQKVVHHLRPLHRITIFHPEVRYPKPAIHWSVLPDELLQLFHEVFEKDRRDRFPQHLLDNLRWTVCLKCGREHARACCPSCTQTTPAAVRETTVIRGRVTATRIFHTGGVILCAVIQNQQVRYLYHEKAQFKREAGSLVIGGELDPRTHFRIAGEATLLARQGQIAVLRSGSETTLLPVDSRNNQPIFDANEQHVYWSYGGQLWRDATFGPQYIGDVMARQTHLWCGKHFGFGFSQAGGVQVAFTFDAQKGGINDAIQLPPLQGQIFDTQAVFADERCWFFVKIQQAGQLFHRCFVIRRDGTVETSAQAQLNDGTWLGNGIRGHCATGSFLLVATDDGIMRVEVDGSGLAVAQTFPDTEPFVTVNSQLLPGADGLYVVNAQQIVRLKIA